MLSNGPLLVVMGTINHKVHSVLVLEVKWAVSSVLPVSDESWAVRLRCILEFCKREVFVG